MYAEQQLEGLQLTGQGSSHTMLQLAAGLAESDIRDTQHTRNDDGIISRTCKPFSGQLYAQSSQAAGALCQGGMSGSSFHSCKPSCLLSRFWAQDLDLQDGVASPDPASSDAPSRCLAVPADQMHVLP